MLQINIYGQRLQISLLGSDDLCRSFSCPVQFCIDPAFPLHLAQVFGVPVTLQALADPALMAYQYEAQARIAHYETF